VALVASVASLAFVFGEGTLETLAGFRRERGTGRRLLAFEPLGVLADGIPNEEQMPPIAVTQFTQEKMDP